MADRSIFEGYALQAVDGKGRVAIPARFRVVMERNSEDREVVVGRHPEDPCLRAYDTGHSAALLEDIRRRERLAEERGEPLDSRIRRNMFGNSEKAPFDASGRFVLPGYYREKAGIGNWAFFVAAAETFEIWAPEVLLRHPDADPGLRDLCAYECRVKGLSL